MLLKAVRLRETTHARRCEWVLIVNKKLETERLIIQVSACTFVCVTTYVRTYVRTYLSSVHTSGDFCAGRVDEKRSDVSKSCDILEVAPELGRAVGISFASIIWEPLWGTILPVAILYVTMVANYGI